MDGKINLHKLIKSSSKWLKTIFKEINFSFEYRTADNNVPHCVITGFCSKGKPVEFLCLRPSNPYFEKFV